MSGGDTAKFLSELQSLPEEEARTVLLAAGERRVKAIEGEWPAWAHEGQLPPDGDDWLVWVMLAGRGFGKTRAGAEWVSAKARGHPGARIALVAANADEARRVMVEGSSGLLAVARDEERGRTRWEPSLGRITFASGAAAFVYSGAHGESLRGPEHHFAWCDELAKWRRPQESWDNLMLGLRAGTRPQAVVTTTPRAVPALKRILALTGVVRTGGRSRDNPHIAALAIEASERAYGGTRFGRQELEGALLDDLEGALWSREVLERARRAAPPPRAALKRVAVGVDPPASSSGDECGIVACGLDGDGVGWVLGDFSAGGLTPEGWARKVAAAAEHVGADLVVAEGNQGGEMVEAVLRGAGLRLPVKRVHARVNKLRRAEPVALHFESGTARLGGAFPELEDQLAAIVTGGEWHGPTRSPDRADAMVWAMTELLLKPQQAEPRIRAL